MRGEGPARLLARLHFVDPSAADSRTVFASEAEALFVQVVLVAERA